MKGKSIKIKPRISKEDLEEILLVYLPISFMIVIFCMPQTLFIGAYLLFSFFVAFMIQHFLTKNEKRIERNEVC